MPTSTTGEAEQAPPLTDPLYRAIWRWHFYAGLLALPFMILLAVTGALYLYKDEINGLLYGDVIHVAASGAPALAPSALVAKAEAALKAPAIGYVPPASPTDAAQIRVSTESAGKRVVFLDPRTGGVLGDLADGGSAGSPFMHLIRKLHSLEYFGWLPNRIIEIVGGWALILVVTGIYLWWPRRQRGGVVSIRGVPSRRVFWRDLHAVTGLFAGVLIFFLAVSGLPWSGYWGNNVNILAGQYGLGYPPEFWDDVPKSAVPMKDAMTKTSWTLENAPMPASTPTGAAPIGIDKAVEIFAGLGLPGGYTLDFPGGEDGVYSASIFPDAVAGERIVHLDQYSGKPLFDGGFRELGGVAAAIEWGISVHMGQEFGTINQLLMLAVCLAVVAMAVSAAVMWWKRRPRGSIGAPRYPGDYRVPRFILAVALVVGLAFPLVGLSILLMLLIDTFLPVSWRDRLA